jgi:hypothetical protein
MSRNLLQIFLAKIVSFPVNLETHMWNCQLGWWNQYWMKYTKIEYMVHEMLHTEDKVIPWIASSKSSDQKNMQNIMKSYHQVARLYKQSGTIYYHSVLRRRCV